MSFRPPHRSASWKPERPNHTSYQDEPTSTATGSNGVAYRYRRVGTLVGARRRVLLQHLRGNLDNRDLRHRLRQCRSGWDHGQVPAPVAEMAHGAIAFITALDLTRVDLLGYSLGALNGPHRESCSLEIVFAAAADCFAHCATVVPVTTETGMDQTRQPSRHGTAHCEDEADGAGESRSGRHGRRCRSRLWCRRCTFVGHNAMRSMIRSRRTKV